MRGVLGNPTKGYFDCSFSINIPKITVYEDRVDISSLLLPRKNTPSEGIVLDYCQLSSKSNATFIESPASMFFPASGKNSLIHLSIKAPLKKVVYHGATFLMGFLSQNGQRIEVAFMCDHTYNLKFEHVRTGKMNDRDKARFLEVLDSYRTPPSAAPTVPPDTTHQQKLPTSIETYISAILEERNHLKNQGGRQYKVTNGRQISTRGGVFTYVFDLETELYLSDDAPIKISANNKKATGNVILCEGFKITVVLQADLGARVSVAHIAVEPWRLLDS